MRRRLEIIVDVDPDGVNCGKCEHRWPGLPNDHDTCELFGYALWGPERCKPCLEADKGTA